MAKPKAIILYAQGTNRDADAAYALERAGATVETIHIHALRDKKKLLSTAQLLVIPGGFSYADTLGAGRLFALDLSAYFVDPMEAFIAAGKPVLGICNGFQTLVKAGFLPAIHHHQAEATLTFNAQGRFECRWVTLLPQSPHCVWTKELKEPIDCPVAHGEGNFVPKDETVLKKLQAGGQIALVYAHANGKPADQTYPENPNGSVLGIAGVCNAKGNVLGLMPHPENHVLPHQHPQHLRRWRAYRLGLALFEQGVKYAR